MENLSVARRALFYHCIHSAMGRRKIIIVHRNWNAAYDVQLSSTTSVYCTESGFFMEHLLDASVHGATSQIFSVVGVIVMPMLLPASSPCRLPAVTVIQLVSLFFLRGTRRLLECSGLGCHLSIQQEAICSCCCCGQESRGMSILGSRCSLHLFWQPKCVSSIHRNYRRNCSHPGTTDHCN